MEVHGETIVVLLPLSLRFCPLECPFDFVPSVHEPSFENSWVSPPFLHSQNFVQNLSTSGTQQVFQCLGLGTLINLIYFLYLFWLGPSNQISKSHMHIKKGIKSLIKPLINLAINKWPTSSSLVRLYAQKKWVKSR